MAYYNRNIHIQPEFSKKNIHVDDYHNFKNGKIYFKHRMKGHCFSKTTPENAIPLLTKNNNIFEMLGTFQTRKIVVDIDNKDIGLSYDDIEGFCLSFRNYINEIYGVHIKFNIYFSYSGDLPTTNKHDKCFFSAHVIIYNLATKTHFESKQLVNDFLDHYRNDNQIEHYFKDNNLLDLKIYTRNRLMRQINQSKEGKIKTLKRIVFCNILNVLTENTTPRLEDLITYITPDVNIIDVELTDNHNETDIYMIYDIPHNYEFVSNMLAKIVPDTLNCERAWKRMLYNILYALHTNGIVNYDDIMADKIIIDFLNVSRVGEYDTDEMETTNKLFIKYVLEDKEYTNTKNIKNKNIIKILPSKTIKWIYTNTDITTGTIKMKYKKIGTEEFFIINRSIAYNINFNILCCDYSIITENKKKRLVCDRERFYSFYHIEQRDNTNIEYLNKYTTRITDCDDIPVNYLHSYMIKAPVGTGKTRTFLRKYIKDILKNADNPLLMLVADTITIAEKHQADITNILIEEGYNPDIIFYYKDKVNDTTHKQTKIIITTYDSYVKMLDIFNEHPPNYIIIDEFKNVLTRVIKIQDPSLTEEGRSILLNQMLDLFCSSTAVCFLDADYDDALRIFISTFIPSKIIHTFSLKDHEKPHKIILQSRSLSYKDMLNNLENNKRFVIASATKKYAHYIFNILRQFKPKDGYTKRILLIDANGATGHDLNGELVCDNIALKKQIIQNTDLLINYDVFSYTPTIITGFSFNHPDHFYKVYVYASNNSIDTTQTAQFTHRIRTTETNEIIVMTPLIKNTINPHNRVKSKSDDFVFHRKLRNKGKDSYDILKRNNNITAQQKMIDKMINHAGDMTNNTGDYIKQQLIQFKRILSTSGGINHSAYLHLHAFELSKEECKKNSFIFYYLATNFEWGVKNIETRFFRIETIPDKKRETNEIVDLSLEHFSKAEYQDNEQFCSSGLKFKNNAEDGEEYNNYRKTLKCKFYGITKTMYEENKEVLDDQIVNVFELARDDITKLKRINYFVFKNHISFLANNATIEDSYIKELMKHCHTHVKDTYLKLFNLHCVFNVLEIMGIEAYEDLKLILNGELMYKKTEDNLNKLYTFMDNNTDIVKFINSTTRQGKNTDKYFKLKSFLTTIFSYIGMKINMGRQTQRCKKDENITIDITASKKISVYNFRLQLLDDNEEDDVVYYADDGHCVGDCSYTDRKRNCYLTPKILRKSYDIKHTLFTTAEKILSAPDFCAYKSIQETEPSNPLLTGVCLL